MDRVEAIYSLTGMPVSPREEESPGAIGTWLTNARSDVNSLAEVLADALARWRTTRRSGRPGANRHPQNVVGWLSCPECQVQVPVCHQPPRLTKDEDGRRVVVMELDTADLALHQLVHELEGR